MNRFKKTAKPEELPTEVPAVTVTELTAPATQAITAMEPDIPQTANFPTFEDLFSKTALRKRTNFLMAFRNIAEMPNGISLKEVYIIEGAGSAKLRDASRGHIRWNPATRNMLRLISAWLISSNMVLLRKETPRPNATRAHATAAIAAQR